MSVFTNPAAGAAEQAAAYTSAVLELLGDREPAAVLREMLSALPRAIEGLSPQQLRKPERPDKWSIGQILQHLADSEVVWAWRMRLILAQDRPRPQRRAQEPHRQLPARQLFDVSAPGQRLRGVGSYSARYKSGQCTIQCQNVVDFGEAYVHEEEMHQE